MAAKFSKTYNSRISNKFRGFKSVGEFALVDLTNTIEDATDDAFWSWVSEWYDLSGILDQIKGWDVITLRKEATRLRAKMTTKRFSTRAAIKGLKVET